MACGGLNDWIFVTLESRQRLQVLHAFKSGRVYLKQRQSRGQTSGIKSHLIPRDIRTRNQSSLISSSSRNSKSSRKLPFLPTRENFMRFIYVAVALFASVTMAHHNCGQGLFYCASTLLKMDFTTATVALAAHPPSRNGPRTLSITTFKPTNCPIPAPKRSTAKIGRKYS